MTYQTTINAKPGLGVVGDIIFDTPRFAQSYILNSADASYNVFGRGFSITSEGNAAAGNAGGTAQFAGILCNPKASASVGDSTNPLNPTLTLPDYSQGELLTMGSMIVTLAAAAAIGDLVVYNNTTGVLSTIAPGADLPVGTSFAYAFVDHYTVTAAGLAVITLMPTLTIPVLA